MNDFIRLHSDDLLSKYGFNDGDLLNCIFDNEKECQFTEYQELLCQVVQQYLIPKLAQKVEICVVKTIHNPIRAEYVDGFEVCWDDPDNKIQLTPNFVDVPIEGIKLIAGKIKQEVKGQQ